MTRKKILHNLRTSKLLILTHTPTQYTKYPPKQSVNCLSRKFEKFFDFRDESYVPIPAHARSFQSLYVAQYRPVYYDLTRVSQKNNQI